MWWLIKKLFEKEKKKTDIDALIEYHKCIDEREKRNYKESPDYVTCDIFKTENHNITIDYSTIPIYGFGSYKCHGINYRNANICIDKICIEFTKRFIYKDFFTDNEIKLSERLLKLLEDENTIGLCFDEYGEIDKHNAINILKNINGEKILEHNYKTRKFYEMEPIIKLRRIDYVDM